MHKDALADGAKLAIDKIFGALPTNDDDSGKDNKNDSNNNSNSNITINKKYLPLLSLLIIPIGLSVFGLIVWMRESSSSTSTKRVDEKKEVYLSSNHNLIGADVEKSTM